jgi:hypothetical protein
VVSRPVSLVLRLLRLALGLALLAALALQLHILAHGGLRLPDFALAAISRHAAADGLVLSAEGVWLDPAGRLLVLQPRLGLTGQEEAFATARVVSLRLRRRALLLGQLRAAWIEVSGLELTLPSLLSPTGTPGTLLRAGEFRLAPPPEDTPAPWRVAQASALVLGVPTAFAGELPDSSPSAPSRPPREALLEGLRRAGAAYRSVAALPLDRLRVMRVELGPDALVVRAELDHLEVPASSGLPPLLTGTSLEHVSLSLALPIDEHYRALAAQAVLELQARHFETPPALALRGGPLALRASPGATLAAELAVSRLEKTDLPLPPVPLVASLRLASAGDALSLEASTRLADAPWQLRLAGSLADRAGSVRASGPLTPAALELLRPFLPPRARPILTLEDPVALDLGAILAPGGRPAQIEVRASAGRAMARGVSFDRASALLAYRPDERSLRADELLLFSRDSRAEGSYEMDTETLDFRFLLSGTFRPASISGWFSGWWDRFWTDFGFGPTPPEADVDIRGRWRSPGATTVYVGASSGPMRLRQLPLDRLHTRLLVARGSVQVEGFHATADAHTATGRFSRFVNPATGAWSRLAFDVRSDFPSEALPLLFPNEGPALIAPFVLEAPPRIHLVGESLGPGSDTPGRQEYDLTLATDSPLLYSGFPLDRLSLRLMRRDSTIGLREIRAGFADGEATGSADLTGPAEARALSFDLALAGADLDLAQTRWRTFRAAAASKNPAAPSAEPAPITEKEARPLGGLVSLQLKASGPLADPLAFLGDGQLQIKGADLARIRLMGPLSNLLSEMGLGFTTLKLTEADARLSLDHRRLVFEEFRLTGPTAAVDASGTYLLPAGDLEFKAKLRPFERSEGLLGSTADFMLSPLSNAMEVELEGTIDAPTWTFTYGPTRLIRRITDKF